MADKELSVLITGKDSLSTVFEKLGMKAEQTAARVNKAGSKSGGAAGFFGAIKSDLEQGQLSLQGVGAAALSAAGPLAIVGGTAAAVGTSLVALTLKTASQGDMFDELSQKTGVSVETLSGLQLVAQQNSMSIEEMGGALNKLNKTMVDAAGGGKEASAAFRAIGVSVTGPNGLRATEDVFRDLADKFREMPDGAQKSALAMKLFGKSGAEMIPILNQGSAAISEQMKRAQELGIVWSTENAAGAAKLMDAVDELKAAFSGLTLAAGQELIPALTTVVGALVDGVVWFNKNKESVYFWTKQMINATPGLGVLIQIRDVYASLRLLLPGGRGGIMGGAMGATAGAVVAGTTASPGRTGNVIPMRGTRAKTKAGYRESFNTADFTTMDASNGTDSRDGWLARQEAEVDKAGAIEQKKSEAILEQQRAFKEAYLGATTDIFQGGTDIMADAMAKMIRGQKVSGKEMLKATGAMLGGVAAQLGDFHVARGVAILAEGGWPPNPAAISSGAQEIAAGLALKTLGALLAGGGGSGSAGAGKHGGGKKDVPNRGEMAPTAGETRITIAGVENLRGRYVMGDFADIVNSLTTEMNKAKRRNVYMEFAA